MSRLEMPGRPGSGRTLGIAAALLLAVIGVVVVTVVSLEDPTVPERPVAGPEQESRSGFPDGSTTGVPAGVRLASSGPLEVETPGVTLDGLLVQGGVVVRAADVTIRRSRIIADGAFGVRVESGSLVIEDSEIVGVSDRCQAAVAWANYTARRVNAHGCRDGLKAGDDTTVVASYIHSQSRPEGVHSDAIQISGGARGVLIEGNTIRGPERQSVSAIKISTRNGPIDDVVVRRNYLAGGGMLLYVTDEQEGFGPPRHVEIVDNVIERGSFRHRWLRHDGDPILRGNVWHDDGGTVAP